MKGKFRNLAGQQINDWLVLERVRINKHQVHWMCRCSCGTERAVLARSLLNNTSMSCGHPQEDRVPANFVHGLSRTPAYVSWNCMIRRCYDPRDIGYKRYGDKGVTVCEQWRNSFEAFLADMGPCPPDHTIDRWPNGQGNYEPGNCRWATKLDQARNRSGTVPITWNGETHIATEWAEITGLKHNAILYRLQAGWPIEKVLGTAARPRKAKT